MLVDLPVEHVLVLIPALFLVGFFFAQLGVLVGVRAEQFDDVSFAQTFVLQPLIFLGGVFYSASLLPEPFQTLTHFNPVYYMIGLVRYGFLGYSEANVALSLALLTLATLRAVRAQPPAVREGLQAARLGRRGPAHAGLHALAHRGALRERQQGAPAHHQHREELGGRLERVGHDAPVGERDRGRGGPVDLADQRAPGQGPLAVEIGEPLQGALVVDGGLANHVCVGGVHGQQCHGRGPRLLCNRAHGP